MLRDLYKKRPHIEVTFIKTSYYKLSPVNDVKNGVCSVSYEYKEHDTAKDLSIFNSADFALDNIIRVGSFDMLKPVVFHTMSNMNVADSFEILSNNVSVSQA